MKTESIRAASSIINRSWLIMQSALPKLAGSIATAPGPMDKLDEMTLEDFFELRPNSSLSGDGIGIVYVHQALVDTSPPIHEKLGFVTTYATLSEEINFLESEGMKGLLIIHDSPGGTVAGCREAAEQISALDVPVVSYASGLMCSASYKLAAGSNQIVASPSATVGNIGSIISWANLEQFWASMGVKYEALISEGADLKSTFHTEPNDEQRAFRQEGINQAGEEFRSHVSQGRANAGAELSDEVFRAGWYSGEKAVELGLVDWLGSKGDALEILRGMIDTSKEV